MLGRLHNLTALQPLALALRAAFPLTRGFAAPPLTSFVGPEGNVPNGVIDQMIPAHDVEDGLPAIQARIRTIWGTRLSKRMRKVGRLPATLSSLPSNNASILLHLDIKEGATLVRKFGRNGVLARPLRLEILDEDSNCIRSLRVLTRNVHINSQTQDLENLTFLFCPQNRVVNVPIPVKLWNTEIAPGVKKGGWLHQVSRTVTLKCEAWAIPTQLELDMRGMDLNDIVRFADLKLPAGTKLSVPDPTQPVVRCAAKVGGGD
jgi:large subunit ribosomal protein L25